MSKKQVSLSNEEVLSCIHACSYCVGIHKEHKQTPIQCTKYSGSQFPIYVNVKTCFTCSEFEWVIEQVRTAPACPSLQKETG
ncbi:hypothetical protein [Marinicrinis sediminis]|uniref:Uncharacterized protein n=1 Tax=Marinicrinis sediminis TaxID=1652465 RepID=A0ABW5R6B9_9BACL